MSARDSLHDWKQDPASHVWLADWRGWKLPYCSVYIIAPEGSWPSKVGISTCARRRVAGMQTSHWKRLVVARAFWCASVAEAKRVEQKTHQLLKEENVYLLGEWFDKKPDQAAEVVQFAAMLENVELHDKIEHPEILAEVATYADFRESQFDHVRFHAENGLPVERVYVGGPGRVLKSRERAA